jgi:hypothetical protein
MIFGPGGGCEQVSPQIADDRLARGVRAGPIARSASKVHATSAVPPTPEFSRALGHFGLLPRADIPNRHVRYSATVRAGSPIAETTPAHAKGENFALAAWKLSGQRPR